MSAIEKIRKTEKKQENKQKPNKKKDPSSFFKRIEEEYTPNFLDWLERLQTNTAAYKNASIKKEFKVVILFHEEDCDCDICEKQQQDSTDHDRAKYNYEAYGFGMPETRTKETRLSNRTHVEIRFSDNKVTFLRKFRINKETFKSKKQNTQKFERKLLKHVLEILEGDCEIKTGNDFDTDYMAVWPELAEYFPLEI